MVKLNGRHSSVHARLTPEWFADQIDIIHEEINEFKLLKARLLAWITAISLLSSVAWGVARDVLIPHPVEAQGRYERR